MFPLIIPVKSLKKKGTVAPIALRTVCYKILDSIVEKGVRTRQDLFRILNVLNVILPTRAPQTMFTVVPTSAESRLGDDRDELDVLFGRSLCGFIKCFR